MLRPWTTISGRSPSTSSASTSSTRCARPARSGRAGMSMAGTTHSGRWPPRSSSTWRSAGSGVFRKPPHNASQHAHPPLRHAASRRRPRNTGHLTADRAAPAPPGLRASNSAPLPQQSTPNQEPPLPPHRKAGIPEATRHPVPPSDGFRDTSDAPAAGSESPACEQRSLWRGSESLRASLTFHTGGTDAQV